MSSGDDDMNIVEEAAPAPQEQQQQKKEQPKSEQPELKLMWVEKYRPSKLDQLIGHENIISTSTRSVQKCNTIFQITNLWHFIHC